MVYGKPVLVMTAGPELLWIGNNPHATGYLSTRSGEPMVEAAPADFRAELAAADELRQQQLFWDETVRFAVAHPERIAGLFVQKLAYFWWFSPQSGREYPGWAVSVYKLLCALVLGLAGWGFAAVMWRRHPEPMLLLLVFLAITSLGQSAFFVEGRHRLAVMPLLLLATATGLHSLARRACR